jgi:hypothetical protein
MRRTILALLCAVFVVLPFLVTQFPPITDLPQQSAQIRLFLQTVADPGSSPYHIQWLTPNSLAYVILGAAWAAAGAANAGRLAMALIGVLWVVAIHWTARRRKRSAAAATLACAVWFNHMVYWGYYSFVLGWPVFLLWLHLSTDRSAEDFSVRKILVGTLVGCFLYMTHVLWLVAGVVWWLLHALVIQRSLKGLAARAACLVLPLAATAIWYPTISSSSMSSPPVWIGNPIQRLGFSVLADSTLGGLRGVAEPILVGILATWIILSLITNRERLRETVDRELLLAALMFLAFSLILPDRYMLTVSFGSRWMPEAMILLLLALPAPAIRPIAAQAFAPAVVTVYCIATSLTWMTFDRKEMSGLPAALNALPAAPKVLGLDLVQRSALIKKRPFMQAFAYAQVVRSGSLNFSFASLPSCLVVFKNPELPPWTHGLEWYPRRVKESDLAYFDFVIINATEQDHELFRTGLWLVAVTREGRWRLYRTPRKTQAPADHVEPSSEVTSHQ